MFLYNFDAFQINKETNNCRIIIKINVPEITIDVVSLYGFFENKIDIVYCIRVQGSLVIGKEIILFPHLTD